MDELKFYAIGFIFFLLLLVGWIGRNDKPEKLTLWDIDTEEH